jgi:hypothetical protein
VFEHSAVWEIIECDDDKKQNGQATLPDLQLIHPPSTPA